MATTGVATNAPVAMTTLQTSTNGVHAQSSFASPIPISSATATASPQVGTPTSATIATASASAPPFCPAASTTSPSSSTRISGSGPLITPVSSGPHNVATLQPLSNCTGQSSSHTPAGGGGNGSPTPINASTQSSSLLPLFHAPSSASGTSNAKVKYVKICVGAITVLTGVLGLIWAGLGWSLAKWTATQQLKQSCINDQALKLELSQACIRALATPTEHFRSMLRRRLGALAMFAASTASLIRPVVMHAVDTIEHGNFRDKALLLVLPIGFINITYFGSLYTLLVRMRIRRLSECDLVTTLSASLLWWLLGAITLRVCGRSWSEVLDIYTLIGTGCLCPAPGLATALSARFLDLSRRATPFVGCALVLVVFPVLITTSWSFLQVLWFLGGWFCALFVLLIPYLLGFSVRSLLRLYWLWQGSIAERRKKRHD